MAPDFCPGWLVEAAHGDGDLVVVDRVPEQEGTAGLAEPAADFFRGMVPADILLALYGDGAGREIGGGPVMAGLLAALGAVAGVGLGQIAGDLDFDRTAETGALVHFFLPRVVRGQA